MPKSKSSQSARQIFASNLRRVRRLKDLTQEQVALDAEVPRAYVSRVERGTINLSIDNAEKLAKSVSTPLKDLFDPEAFVGLD